MLSVERGTDNIGFTRLRDSAGRLNRSLSPIADLFASAMLPSRSPVSGRVWAESAKDSQEKTEMHRTVQQAHRSR